MADDHQLDHLINVLYETELDPSCRAEELGLCGRYAGGVDAQFLTIDKAHDTPIAELKTIFIHAFRFRTMSTF